jgi:hypothetical protein
MIHTGVVTQVQRLWARRIAPQTQLRTAVDTLPLRLVVSRADQAHPFTVIQVNGPLDRRTVAALIDCAADLYANGTRRLLIDLSATPRIELSGLFALHSIARLYRGDPLPDPEDGWSALHEAAQVAPAAHGEGIRLVAPAAIARVISQSKVCQLLVVYNELERAMNEQ